MSKQIEDMNGGQQRTKNKFQYTTEVNEKKQANISIISSINSKKIKN
jgi:hypothetical protein